MNLASELRDVAPRVGSSPWPGHEHYAGYGVMVLPFSSGHLLGLRVFPENDFAPYESVWHRTPDGAWSIYNDGPSLRTTCPRWWGAALAHAELTNIELSWTGANELRVEMEEPRLVWTLSMTATPLLGLLNTLSAALPLWTWKPAILLRAREWIAKRLLGMGDLRFAFETPNHQDAVMMPERIFFIASSTASLDGRDLGHPVPLPSNPTIGGVSLPSRPVFVTGQAHARIDDPEEYRRTREAFGAG
jgi:hypothetical protein